MRGESGCAGQRVAGPGYEATAQHRDGHGLHAGAVAGDASELLGAGRGGRSEGPHRMQGLLRRYKWSWEKLRGLLPALAAQCLPDDLDDLIGPGFAVTERGQGIARSANLKPRPHKDQISVGQTNNMTVDKP